MTYKLYILLSAILFLGACSSDDSGGNDLPQNQKIELSFAPQGYNLEVVNGQTRAVTTRAKDPGTAAEREIVNVYVFLFPTLDTQTLVKFASTDPSPSGGEWIAAANKVTFTLTQGAAGNRNVYVVANYNDELKAVLDNVTKVDGTGGLKEALSSTDTPWSGDLTTHLKTPILMSGMVKHDFNANPVSKTVELERAFAKLQINITLRKERQSTPTIEQGVAGSTTTVNQYKYKLINFDKETYAWKPIKGKKKNVLTSSADWINWDEAGILTQYTLTGDTVRVLTLTTYLNEREPKEADKDVAKTEIALKLPYNSSGSLPPPEFGDETYRVILPGQVERNNLYIYNVDI